MECYFNTINSFFMKIFTENFSMKCKEKPVIKFSNISIGILKNKIYIWNVILILFIHFSGSFLMEKILMKCNDKPVIEFGNISKRMLKN